jgi:hypothetical protein
LWHVAKARKGATFVGQAYRKFQSEMKCAEWCFELMREYREEDIVFKDEEGWQRRSQDKHKNKKKK